MRWHSCCLVVTPMETVTSMAQTFRTLLTTFLLLGRHPLAIPTTTATACLTLPTCSILSITSTLPVLHPSVVLASRRHQDEDASGSDRHPTSNKQLQSRRSAMPAD